MKGLKNKVKEELEKIDPRASFDIFAYELYRDPEAGWISSDRWRILRGSTAEGAADEVLERWTKFNVNCGDYSVKDINFNLQEGQLEVGVEFLPLCEIEVHPAVWEVYVGNIGLVYRGKDYQEALETYEEYLSQSVSDYGRASGETVTILADNETFAVGFSNC